MMLRWIHKLFFEIWHRLGFDGWIDADYVEVIYE